MLFETDMLRCRHVDSPIDPNSYLFPNFDHGEILDNPKRYMR